MVFLVVLRRHSQLADSQEFVLASEVGPLRRTPSRCDVFPTAAGEKAVVAAGDQLGAVLEGDAVGGLARLPQIDNLGRDVASVRTAAFGAVHMIACADVPHRSGAAVGHQDRGVTRQAVDARVTAAAVDVDRPVGRGARTGWDAVEDAFRGDVQELEVRHLARAAHRREQLVDPEQRRLAVVGGLPAEPVHRKSSLTGSPARCWRCCAGPGTAARYVRRAR